MPNSHRCQVRSPEWPGIHIPMHCNAWASHLCNERLCSRVGDPFGKPSNSTKLLECLNHVIFMSFLQIHKNDTLKFASTWYLVARELLNSMIIKAQNCLQRCGMKFPSRGAQRNDGLGFCSTQSLFISSESMIPTTSRFPRQVHRHLVIGLYTLMTQIHPGLSRNPSQKNAARNVSLGEQLHNLNNNPFVKTILIELPK